VILASFGTTLFILLVSSCFSILKINIVTDNALKCLYPSILEDVGNRWPYFSTHIVQVSLERYFCGNSIIFLIFE